MLGRKVLGSCSTKKFGAPKVLLLKLEAASIEEGASGIVVVVEEIIYEPE
jgi:hypothetical protein